jgi:thiol:disulfide interchange protein/DsbC/DsbD-like thiol-disulfide interchange protein
MAFGCLFLVGAATEKPSPDEPALDDKNPVRVSLLSDVAIAAVGEEFQIGTKFEMAPGWHIYWIFPGNTGRPTRVDLSYEEGIVLGQPPRYPAPEVFESDNLDELSFGYSGQVLIVANAAAIERPPAGLTRIQASLSWLACKQLCVIGKKHLDLDLAVGDVSKPSPYVGLFRTVRSKLPEPASATLSSLSVLALENHQIHMRLKLEGLEAVERFIPRWFSSGGCKLISYGISKDAQGSFVADMVVSGASCLPQVGGVIQGKRKGAAQKEPSQFFEVAALVPSVSKPSTESTTQPTLAPKPDKIKDRPASQPEIRDRHDFWKLLFFAFIGGLLLNVMPCVIPVVVPKMLYVVRSVVREQVSSRERRRILLSNSLAYTGGVLITLLGLGVLVAILRYVGTEVGWGFQFQNPWFLTMMIALLVVAGLGMLRVFPIQSSTHVEDLKACKQYRKKDPLLESFMTGLLVTFLGTPCTAPFLGPALGYAFTQSTADILLFLVVVGFGLSAPFLLIGVWTGWTKILPTRVSPTYDRVMRGMAFLFFGTALWLGGVLADGYGASAAFQVLWFVLVLSLGCWVFGLVATESDPWKKRVVRLLPIALAVGLFGAWVLSFDDQNRDHPIETSSSAGISWQPFSEADLQDLRKRGKTIFVDFTAQWCLNCKANERLVIETSGIVTVLDRLGVVALKADYTTWDPMIQRWLQRFGRAGVPLYLVFPACGNDDQVIVLPEILTTNRLRTALESAGKSRDSC